MQKTIISLLVLLWTIPVVFAQKPVLVIPTGHSSGVHSFSCSSDGKFFLTAGGDNLVKIWNNKGQELRTFKPEDTEYRQVQISPDGTQMLAAYCQENNNAWILDAFTGETLFILEGQEQPLQLAIYSPDGKIAATADQAGSIALWNTKNGKLMRRWKGHNTNITSLTFSPDGKLLASYSSDGLSQIWHAQNGAKNAVLSQALSKDSLRVLAFSPDRKTLFVSSPQSTFSISLWSMETRQILATTTGLNGIFSPDGQYLCVFKFNGAAILPANDLNGTPLHMLVAPMMPTDVAIPFYDQKGFFLPDGKSILLINYNYRPTIYDFRTSEALWDMKGYAQPVQSVSFSPDGKTCLVGSLHDIAAWDLEKGQNDRRLKGHVGDVRQARYTPDGQHIVSVGNDYGGLVWDAQSGENLFNASGIGVFPLQTYAGILAISPDGQYFAKGHSPSWEESSSPVSLWNVKDGTLRGMVGAGGDSLMASIYDLAFSPDGKWLAVLDLAGLHLWDLAAERWVWRSKPDFSGFKSVAFSPDGAQLVTGTEAGFYQYWNAQTGKLTGEKRTYAEKEEITYGEDLWLAGQGYSGASDLVFSKDGKWLAAPGPGKTIQVWDVVNWSLVYSLSGHDNVINSLDFSPDGRWIISGSADNTTRIWDLKKGTEVAKIIHLSGDNWVVTTPSGLFDASEGARKMMYYVVDYQREKVVIGLEQLQERYWQPGLLAAILGRSPYPVRDVGAFDNLPLFPSIEQSTRIEFDQLHIRLRERNGGLGKLNLIINGITRAEDLNPERNKDLKIDLKRFSRFLRADTANTIELEVYEAKNNLKSGTYLLHYLVSVKKRGEGNEETPTVNDCQMPRHLYLIVVGTSLYPQGVDSLPSANEDALEMARVLQEAGKQLYDDRVHLKLLATRGGESPSKANIAAAFEAFKSASVCDVLVVFFAGHGSNWGKDGDKSNFYYLTQDITFNKLNDEGIRKAFAISDQELKDWMREIPAENKLLILDACNSGQAAINMGGVIARDMDPDKIVAFNLMSGNSGSYVISGSSESGASFESVVFGHGLLTYSLLEGINGTALDGTKVDVLPLLLKSYKRVGELAKSLGKEQTPIIAKPRGNASFYVGRNDGNIKIDLPETKPMVIRSVFFEQGTFSDQLSLTKSVNAAFRGKEIRGKQAPWFYSDIPEHPQGFTVRGAYTSQPDKTVSVRCSVLKGETPLGEPFTVKGPNDARALSEMIVKAAKPLIRLK
ncbi:MAG TPA: caspase family protein [Saprospiraceae bacterium]|nr:caspase family protein [Saprospiraceae bacterium]